MRSRVRLLGSDRDANTDSHRNANAYTDANRNSDPDAYPDADRYAHTDPDTDADPKPDVHRTLPEWSLRGSVGAVWLLQGVCLRESDPRTDAASLPGGRLSRDPAGLRVL